MQRLGSLVLVMSALFMSALAVSCVREARPPEVATDFVVPPIGTNAPPPPPAPSKPKICQATLLAGPIQKSSFGCVIDEQISKTHGLLTSPCSGDGDAVATFGQHTYRGTVKGGVVELEVKTELDWPGDNCRWGTTATLTGGFPELRWSYHDYVVRGQACSGTCTATASVAIHAVPQHDPDAAEDDDEPDR